MLGAVIFDFDGVITDSEILHFRSFNVVLARHSIQITKEEYYKDYLGLSDLDFFEMIAAKAPALLDRTKLEDLLTQKESVFEELADDYNINYSIHSHS